MFRPRITPVLLLSDRKLVKSVGFKNYRYIGDPVNAARLFSEMQADELIILDIDATRNKKSIDPELVRQISNETSMPLGVGGGIENIQQIQELINSGAEKVIIGSAALKNPKFIEDSVKEFGSSTISVCVDLKRENETYTLVYQNASVIHKEDYRQTIKNLEELGVGEIILQSVSNDGMKTSYDCGLIKSISEFISVPLVAMGGAGNLKDLRNAFEHGASAMAASSLFVFEGNGILISYPEREEISRLFA